MTEQQIDTEALRRLADAATPGPWENTRNGVQQALDAATKVGDYKYEGVGIVPEEYVREEDAEFIAAARTALPQLLDQLDQAEARIKEVRTILDQHHDQTADALWLDINDHIPGGDLGNPDMPCGRGVCALGDGHPGPCRC